MKTPKAVCSGVAYLDLWLFSDEIVPGLNHSNQRGVDRYIG